MTRCHLGEMAAHSPFGSFAENIERAIAANLPRETGTRHDCIFQCVRSLIAIPGLSQAIDEGTIQLEQISHRWWLNCEHIIATKDYWATDIDFAIAWEGVKLPAGSSPVAQAFKYAEQCNVEPHDAIANHPRESPIVSLDAACWFLSRLFEDNCNQFFLSCKDAAKHLGVSKSESNRMLRYLEIKGVLQRVSTGSKVTGKANQYRYIAD